MKSNKNIKLNVIIEETSNQGGYSAYVHELPGCVSEGDTFEEVKENIIEAIELYLEDLTKEEIDLITEENNITITQVNIPALAN